MEQLFYQARNLVTLKENGQYRSIFRSPMHLLAEFRGENIYPIELLATDTKKTIMHAHDGVKKEHHTYTVFGHSGTLLPKRTLQGFNGEPIDHLLSTYHLGQGYRTYSPGLMRFQSPDSLSPFGKGGVNYYAYCGGDPVNYTDPTGHVFVHLTKGQTMKVRRHSAVALPHKFNPSSLKRTTSHASALKAGTPKYARPPEDYFKRIGEPDIFESIINNLTLDDALAFSNTSEHNRSHAVPFIYRYLSLAKVSNASVGAARAGVLPGVPRIFGQNFELHPYLQDINMLRDVDILRAGGVRNVVRLRTFDRLYTAETLQAATASID